MNTAMANITKNGQSSRGTGTGAASGRAPSTNAGTGRGVSSDSSAFMRLTATFVSPREVTTRYTPTSSVSVKLASPRVTCACTVCPDGVVTVAVDTPCSTGSRIGCPACSWRLS